MSALKFSTFCGNCFSTIASGSGIVLSCGDFLCNNCSSLEQDTCPACCTTGIKIAKLAHPPPEVVRNMEDPATHLEGIFTTLKFQLSHYKDTLGYCMIICFGYLTAITLFHFLCCIARASQKLVAMKKAETEYKWYTVYVSMVTWCMLLFCLYDRQIEELTLNAKRKRQEEDYAR